MKTVNLLPKERQKELYYESLFQSLLGVFIVSLLSFALVFLFQFGTQIYLKSQATALDSQISLVKSQVNKNENSEIKKKIQEANNYISDFNSLADAAPKWSNVLKAFAPLPPPGVKINTFNVNPNTKAITINGLSPTRELVIATYNSILSDKKNFYGIDYPFENLASALNVNFRYNFFIQDSLLK